MLQQDRKNSALRVQFLTDAEFVREDDRLLGALKRRALRAIQKLANWPVVENSRHPDITFKILRREDGDRSWMLRKVNRDGVQQEIAL